jgi:hypothetical protein
VRRQRNFHEQCRPELSVTGLDARREHDR